MNIKENLGLLLEAPHQCSGKMVRHCKNIALAYLKKKVSGGNHYILNLSDTLNDLAWDCIADLFERNEHGRYVQFENYFNCENIDELSEAKVQMKLRRLVFSRVNDGLFRNFGIYDMSLSKIIRNLKLAAGKHDLYVSRLDSDNYLFFGPEDEEETAKPIMPPEFLEIKLTHRIHATMETPEVLAELTEIFSTQNRYQKKYPLVQIARVIRRSFVNLQGEYASQNNPHNPLLAKDTLKKILQQTLDHCGDCFKQTYVKKGKIDSETLDNYLSCIKDILHHHYITDSDVGDSYYDHFNEIFPGITKEEYRQQHRQYLEYMVKQVRRDLIHQIKKVI